MRDTLKSKLKNFVRQMELELQANNHKGEFEEWTDVDEMFVELEWHKAKLMLEMRKNKNTDKVKEYLADCANILLAIGNTWELYNEKQEDGE